MLGAIEEARTNLSEFLLQAEMQVLADYQRFNNINIKSFIFIQLFTIFHTYFIVTVLYIDP